MSDHEGAIASARTRVAAVRDDPTARLALMARLFQGPTGNAPRHRPFRRAALSFMRGVLNPLNASAPGSVWWRAMNDRLLRDGCEAVGLLGGWAGEPSSQAVQLWLQFSAAPTGRNWYRAHNASIVGGYLEHRDLASPCAAEPLSAHARRRELHRRRAEPRPDARLRGDRVATAGVYEWSAQELDEPRLLELVREGSPIYAWPFDSGTSGVRRACRSSPASSSGPPATRRA